MANILALPNSWTSLQSITPPPSWDAGNSWFEWFGVFGVGAPAQGMTYNGLAADIPASMAIRIVTGSDPYDVVTKIRFTYDDPGGDTFQEFTLAESATANHTLTIPETATGVAVTITSNGLAYPYSYSMDIALTGLSAVDRVPVVSYNCECDDLTGNRTLLELSESLMRRLGYATQVNNPPPGMMALLKDFLQGAQRALYRRYDALRTERIYQWDLVEGVRYYDLADNSDVCTKRLDPLKVSWVGVERDGVWYPLRCGITPERYSFDQTGWPSRYEIRQCLEIWPAPTAEAGKIRVKGHFELEAFDDDDDPTTINDELVFLLALANAKAHYGQPDAANYVGQMEAMMQNIVAGSHHTRRYIPGRRDAVLEPVPVWDASGWPPP